MIDRCVLLNEVSFFNKFKEEQRSAFPMSLNSSGGKRYSLGAGYLALTFNKMQTQHVCSTFVPGNDLHTKPFNPHNSPTGRMGFLPLFYR